MVGWGGGVMKGTWRRTHANIPQSFCRDQKGAAAIGHVLLAASMQFRFRTELGENKLTKNVSNSKNSACCVSLDNNRPSAVLPTVRIAV